MEREERQRERNVDLLLHSSMHSLVAACMYPDGAQTHNLGTSGPHSNQLSFLTRARARVLKSSFQIRKMKHMLFSP